MHTELFLFRPKPYPNECLTSFMQRVAMENSATPHELWRLLLPPSAHYPQSSISSTLDIYPNNLFDTRKFESMLYLEESELDPLTFLTVLRKLGVTKENLSRCRILSELTEPYRKYCPCCLKNTKYYKLIWQVKETLYCDEHNIKLHDSCWRCNTKIPLLPSEGVIGQCPVCNANLSHAPQAEYIASRKDFRILDDWNFLLDNSKNSLSVLENYTPEQNIAFKILYLVNNHKSNKLNSNMTLSLSSILQLARGSKTTKTYIHLNTILEILRETTLNMQEFLTLNPTQEFINSIIVKKSRLINQYACIAPWCKSYLKEGSLLRTATTVRQKKDGQVHSYYMYCKECATEYCLNHDTKELTERGYFIDVAWNKVRKISSNNLSIKEMAKLLGITEDKVKRSIIFLAANKLVDVNLIPLNIPYNHEPKIIKSFENLIKQGKGFKDIQKTLKVSYNTSLYYWILPQIRITYLNYKKQRTVKNLNNTFDENFNASLKHFIESKESITIKKICSYMNISPETLRLKGLLPKLKEIKAIQKEEMELSFKNQLKERAMEVIQQSLNSGIIINSEALYNKLGIRRNVIVRKSPDVTQYITKLLKEYKSSQSLKFLYT